MQMIKTYMLVPREREWPTAATTQVVAVTWISPVMFWLTWRSRVLNLYSVVPNFWMTRQYWVLSSPYPADVWPWNSTKSSHHPRSVLHLQMIRIEHYLAYNQHGMCQDWRLPRCSHRLEGIQIRKGSRRTLGHTDALHELAQAGMVSYE